MASRGGMYFEDLKRGGSCEGRGLIGLWNVDGYVGLRGRIWLGGIPWECMFGGWGLVSQGVGCVLCEREC